jgi:5-oxoprolinase (ATP-hydrolysing)
VTDRAASPGQRAGDRDGQVADGGGGPGGDGPGRAGWRLAVDTGGTFTDCLAVDPRGRLRRAKVLSTAALRTRIAARLGEAAVRLMPIGGAGGGSLPAGFFAGCSLRLLGSGEAGAAGWRVLASGPEGAGSASDGPWEDAGGTTGAGAAAAAAAGAAGDNGPARRLGATLRLDWPLPAGELAGAAVELQAAEEAPVLAARLVTATPPGQPLPPLAMRLATTRGTNALLERKGAPVALFLTRGFADLLRIGTQQRPELFALAVERPAPLYRAVVEVDERLAADGSEIAPLDLAAVRGPAGELLAAGVSCAAVALLHSYRDPRHERELGAFLRELGFRHVSLSAELAPLIKLLPRAETAVVDAYLAPVLADYLAAVAAELPSGALHVMTSAGGLVRASSFRAKDSLLSGPAGGVVGAARAGRASGFERVIAFDMGGTSTDVARFDGDFEYLFEHRVGDAHLVAPALAIESVAAGGGSICAYHGGRLQVGPESAGAWPGPACYGAGGPLTLTDVNLLLGRLAAGRFEIPLDPGAAERAATALLDSLEVVPAGEPEPAAARRDEVLAGLLAIADERMAEAIRGISLRRGYDPAEYALVAFGGAGAQHACAVAALLGMDTVLVPADAGLLSALGLGAAVVERFAQRQVLLPLAAAAAHLDGWCEELGREAAAAVAAEGVPQAEVEVRRRIVALRFAGQESTLPVEYLGAAALAGAFAAAYREVYGYEPEGRAIEVESLRVVASSGRVAASAAQGTAQEDTKERAKDASPFGGAGDGGEAGDAADAGEAGPAAAVHRVTMQQAFIGGAWRELPAYERSSLVVGADFAGPALVVEDHTATVVEADWTCRLDETAALVLRRPWPLAPRDAEGN